MACASTKPCYVREQGGASSYMLWDRIGMLQDALQHKGMGVICGRRRLDLAAACRTNRASPDTSPAPGASGALIPADGSAYPKSYMVCCCEPRQSRCISWAH